MKKIISPIVLLATVALAFFSCQSDDSNAPAPPADSYLDIKTKLTGGASKVWYWSASEAGHLAYGENSSNAVSNFYGNQYQAAAFALAGTPNSCLYNNKLTFSLQNNDVKFELDNGGATLFNAAFVGVGGGSGQADSCLGYSAGGSKSVTLSASDSVVAANGIAGQTTGTSMTFSDGGFMGYYIGQSTYEILSLTNTRMVVRAVLGGDTSKAYYHTFTTTQPTLPDNFVNLVWSDEFNTPGAPDSSKWSYNLGGGGWGNNESQYYTNSAENVIVQDGVLKITAKKQSFNGYDYTSARLVSENKYDFKYGKLVFRAKLPTGAGTWPALWMLGKNYTTNAWPSCGEIDVMEHVGNQQDVIHSTLHYPGHSGGNGDSATTFNSTVSTTFHDYTVVWGAASIKFYVDDVMYHSFANNASTPFNANFFMIMNMAMGGNFGGAIDPNFTEATMEVDYVRVYN